MSEGNPVRGLSVEQRLKMAAHLPLNSKHHGNRTAGERPMEGWFIYRIPTTINPPTTLRLHYRDRNGKLQQVISITEGGITR